MEILLCRASMIFAYCLAACLDPSLPLVVRPTSQEMTRLGVRAISTYTRSSPISCFME